MSQNPDLYCVMGNPVAHSRSPAIHARFAELTSEPIAYERRLVPMDGFTQGVRDFAAEGGGAATSPCLSRPRRQTWPPRAASVCNWQVRPTR